MRTAAADLRRVLTGTVALAIMWTGLIDAFLGLPVQKLPADISNTIDRYAALLDRYDPLDGLTKSRRD